MPFKLFVVIKPTESTEFWFEEMEFKTKQDAQDFSDAYEQARHNVMGISPIREVEESEPEA